MARGALFFTCYDEFDVLAWFPRENIQECVRLHANGSNRAVSGLFWSRLEHLVLFRAKRLGERSFPLMMMSLMYLDGSHVKTSKNARLHTNGSNRAVSRLLWSRLEHLVLFRAKRLGERSFSLVMMSLMYSDGSHAKTSKNACIYMRTAQTGLFQSVWVNSVHFHAKRLGERSFSLVMMSLMYLDGSHTKTSKNAGVLMQTAQTGLFQSVWANSVLFHAKRLRKRCFSLVVMTLMYLDGSHTKISKNSCVYM